MAKSLQTRFGKIKKLHNNPRKISKVQMQKLVDSLYEDKDFMPFGGIVIDENNEILSGNQRYTALQTIHEELQGQDDIEDVDWQSIRDGVIPDKWVLQMTRPSELSEAEWEAKKKRYVIKMNSPEGMSGEFDYEILQAEFGMEILGESGIDFANLTDDVQKNDGEEKTEEIEGSPVGENNERIASFKDLRNSFKNRAWDMAEAAHYVCFVFQNTEQKHDFLEKAKIGSRYGLFANGIDLAKAMGIELVEAKGVRAAVELSPVKDLKAMTLNPEADEDDKEDDNEDGEGEES